MNTKVKTFTFVGLCLLVFCFSPTLHAQSAKSEAAGILAYDQEVIDYGEVAYQSDGNRTFTFKNVGESPVVIIDVKTSCGCTVATKPTTPIMPGESSEITVNYKTSKAGSFTKTITVISNAKESRKVLKIKGKVLKAESRR